MSNEKSEEKDTEMGEVQARQCDRALLCPEEWADPTGRKVIGEYHKEGLPDAMAEVEADLESFEEYWSKRGISSVESEYHKMGAPYIWESKDISGEQLRSPALQEEETSEEPQESTIQGEGDIGFVDREGGGEGGSPTEKREETAGQSARIQRPIDISTLEVISYALFRVVFGKGVRIPIKRDSLVDMDITIRGKEVLVNTNQLYFTIPELAVWHIVYTHKGKPILEFGRGVRKGMRIHRFRALLLALEFWRGGRKVKSIRTGSPVAIKGKEE